MTWYMGTSNDLTAYGLYNNYILDSVMATDGSLWGECDSLFSSSSSKTRLMDFPPAVALPPWLLPPAIVATAGVKAFPDRVIGHVCRSVKLVCNIVDSHVVNDILSVLITSKSIHTSSKNFNCSYSSFWFSFFHFYINFYILFSVSWFSFLFYVHVCPIVSKYINRSVGFMCLPTYFSTIFFRFFSFFFPLSLHSFPLSFYVS